MQSNNFYYKLDRQDILSLKKKNKKNEKKWKKNAYAHEVRRHKEINYMTGNIVDKMPGNPDPFTFNWSVWRGKEKERVKEYSYRNQVTNRQKTQYCVLMMQTMLSSLNFCFYRRYQTVIFIYQCFNRKVTHTCTCSYRFTYVCTIK